MSVADHIASVEETGADSEVDEKIYADGAKGPERRCVLTRAIAPKEQLIRLVLGPDGSVVADLAGKLPGRGASVTPDRALLTDAISTGRLAGSLSRAFKTSVDRGALDTSQLDAWAAALHRRCADRLGQARRSGECVTGLEKIRNAVSGGIAAGLLLTASDVGVDGERKGAALAAAFDARQDRSFTRDVLSNALGTDNSVHVLVFKGRNADLLISDLERYRGITAPDKA